MTDDEVVYRYRAESSRIKRTYKAQTSKIKKYTRKTIRSLRFKKLSKKFEIFKLKRNLKKATTKNKALVLSNKIRFKSGELRAINNKITELKTNFYVTTVSKV